MLEIEDSFLRRLAIAEALAKRGFNPDEPRDARGRWTDGGITISEMGEPGAEATHGRSDDEPGVLPAGAARVTEPAPSFFGEIAPEVVTALTRLAARFTAPTAFLGTLFIPANSDLQQEGTVQDRPDLSYHWDRDTGRLTLWQDGTLVASGRMDPDNVFRDAARNP